MTAGTARRELVSCCQASRSLLPVLGGATRCSSVTVDLYVDLIICMLEKAKHKYVHQRCNCEIWIDTSEVGYFYSSSSFQSASVMPGVILDLILMPFCSMRISFPKAELSRCRCRGRLLLLDNAIHIKICTKQKTQIGCSRPDGYKVTKVLLTFWQEFLLTTCTVKVQSHCFDEFLPAWKEAPLFRFIKAIMLIYIITLALQP